jgi:hypothetical protein
MENTEIGLLKNVKFVILPVKLVSDKDKIVVYHVMLDIFNTTRLVSNIVLEDFSILPMRPYANNVDLLVLLVPETWITVSNVKRVFILMKKPENVFIIV